MRGLMMDFPLTLNTLLERAHNIFSKTEIVSRDPQCRLHRYTYADFYRRARQLASALLKAGLRPGDRVATLMWNHSTHLEAYFGVPVAHGVLHTLNLRLHPHEIAFIANHAEDRFLIVDDVLLPTYEKFKDQVKFERVFVVPFCSKGGPSGKPAPAAPAGTESYEEFLNSAPPDLQYPDIDENDAAALCFTSGTTGNPKGVLYSHRAIVLHSFASAMVDAFAIGQRDTVLPISPMFHANAWGIPFTSVMVGAKIVYAGPNVDPESLLDLIASEEVTVACAVPTVWIGVLCALERNPGRWKLLHNVHVACGGTAPPEAMIRALDAYGFHLTHLWGMTETAPLATTGGIRGHMLDWSADEKYRVRAAQGWTAPFIELRVRSGDEIAPCDGKTPGELEIRGPWVSSSYYNAPETANRWCADGWFKTGDMATLDEDGYLRIVDRGKDMIKSGGEWISSVDLENAIMGHPDVREAAVIAVPHPKWDERPLAVVVPKPGAKITAEALREFLAPKFAKWQLPDAFVFAAEIPRTSVGKFQKIKLRQQFVNWKWE
jgi:fatty-acyl-CoA synthase